MKKIISINTGGRIISIVPDAWQMHLAYIKTLYCYFSKEQGCFEIINDIENRIAELMMGVINERNSAINEMDIENIIRLMGTTEEFIELDNDDWDLSITSLEQYNSCSAICRIGFFCEHDESKFFQLEEFKPCSD